MRCSKRGSVWESEYSCEVLKKNPFIYDHSFQVNSYIYEKHLFAFNFSNS